MSTKSTMLRTADRRMTVRSTLLRLMAGLTFVALTLSSGVATATPAASIEQAATTAATISRAEIINRAKVWVAEEVPYSKQHHWSDGYRQDGVVTLLGV